MDEKWVLTGLYTTPAACACNLVCNTKWGPDQLYKKKHPYTFQALGVTISRQHVPIHKLSDELDTIGRLRLTLRRFTESTQRKVATTGARAGPAVAPDQTTVRTLATSRGLTRTADTTAAPAAARERSAKPMSLSAAGGGGGGGPDPEACSMAAETVRDQGRNRNLAAGRAKEGRRNRAAAEEFARREREEEQSRWTWLGSAPLLAGTFQGNEATSAPSPGAPRHRRRVC